MMVDMIQSVLLLVLLFQVIDLRDRLATVEQKFK
jgi:hypothetical protein